MIALAFLAQLAITVPPKADATVSCAAGSQTCTVDARTSTGTGLSFKLKLYSPVRTIAADAITKVNFPAPGKDSALLYVTDAAKKTSQKLLRFTVPGIGLPPAPPAPKPPPPRVDTVRIVRVDTFRTPAPPAPPAPPPIIRWVYDTVTKHDTATLRFIQPELLRRTGYLIDSTRTTTTGFAEVYQIIHLGTLQVRPVGVVAWRQVPGKPDGLLYPSPPGAFTLMGAAQSLAAIPPDWWIQFYYPAAVPAPVVTP